MKREIRRWLPFLAMFCPERSRGEPSKFMSFRYASANLAGTKASLAYSLRLFHLTLSLAAGCRQVCSQLFDAKRSVRFHSVRARGSLFSCSPRSLVLKRNSVVSDQRFAATFGTRSRYLQQGRLILIDRHYCQERLVTLFRYRAFQCFSGKGGSHFAVAVVISREAQGLAF